MRVSQRGGDTISDFNTAHGGPVGAVRSAGENRGELRERSFFFRRGGR